MKNNFIFKFISNFIKSILILLIRMYQLLLSPIMGQECKFTPSCSKYSKEAIEKHGSFYGVFLTVKRILKCNPWSKSGHDPVPDVVNKSYK